MGKLTGKKVLITGCSGGIGKAVAIRFAEEGANLSICARSHDALMETKAICESKGAKVVAVVCDITKVDQLENLMKETIEGLGGVDVLINNAVDAKPGTPFMEQSEEYLMQVFEGAFLATWRLMKLCFPYMKENGGRIINFASSSGMRGAKGFAAYGSMKEAIRGLTKIMANEWGQYGITVNSIAPTAITEKIQVHIDNLPEGKRNPEGFGYVIPAIGRVGTAYDDVAPILVFMASDDSAYLTGELFRADGGGAIFS